MSNVNILEDIFICIKSIQNLFKEYEFLHVCIENNIYGYSNNQNITILKPEDALRKLKNIYFFHLEEIDDNFPKFRRTYIKDLLESIFIQVDYFATSQSINTPLSQVVEKLLGVALPVSFPVFEIAQRLNEISIKLGNKSLKDFLKSNICRLNLKSSIEISTHISKLEKNSKQMIINCYSTFLGDSVKSIADKAHLLFVNDKNLDIPGHYKYRGKYSGEVTIRDISEYDDKISLEKFFYHEYIPGHHFYYCLREEEIKNNNLDIISCLDPYYSPENVVNEGLAVCFNSIISDSYGLDLSLSIEIDKLFFKIMYNIWYLTYVDLKSTLDIEIFFAREFGLNKEQINSHKETFLGELKYYMPVYPIGIDIVDNYLKKYPKKYWKYLYSQHSVHTILKLQKWIDK